MIWLRSILYWLAVPVVTPIFCVIAILILPLPPMLRYRIIRGWSWTMLKWLKFTCGLTYRVEGIENLPADPAVVMCKHQSAWETLALQHVFPPQVWVLKKELLKLPIFGWGLATLSPIAIDRSNRAEAQKQLIAQGKDRLAKGFWIVIFPEGTRVPSGGYKPYKQGGARLAVDLEVPIVPVALNSGEFWPKNSFLKWPGEITMVIGKPIEPAGRSPQELTQEVETWIENEIQRFGGVGPCYSPKK
ncbi:lysophospholipid acyltransferase family protein [Iodobacter fluviatilis]|uniref:1-acyl-sn-glycerol-3-phosphate acyltransferase n=1 Tax=Iodobacter fluviatilis TaxID=537 RepID=A0A377SSQ1_9NEIS|nr:lysophospholipid acyltransferase family protein [Iodobacter fluviatilis]TCU82199.1 1-acyl-sn-glycerol-3-phosphate acyltransferase [Iodobacter fluviatilis]STR45094.1 1-acyl-sn-glycerol-3-phosphate acyltransferase [Iodobacter fluviatilis]